MRELKKRVYRRANKGLPIWHHINFSLGKWKFDALYIYVGFGQAADNMCAVQEVIEDEAWIVYEKDERGHLKEISLYKESSEAESAFLSCLERKNIICCFSVGVIYLYPRCHDNSSGVGTPARSPSFGNDLTRTVQGH